MCNSGNYIVRLSTLIVVFVTAGVLNIGTARASNGIINVIGNIVTNTCNISLDDRSKTVHMGVVSSKQFMDGTKTAFPTPFTLTLVDCGPAASAVRVGFYGPKDPYRSDLLALDTGTGAATGMGIALLDSNKAEIPINTYSPTPAYEIEPNALKVVLHFYAQYTANGALVGAGKADSTATFRFYYE